MTPSKTGAIIQTRLYDFCDQWCVRRYWRRALECASNRMHEEILYVWIIFVSMTDLNWEIRISGLSWMASNIQLPPKVGRAGYVFGVFWACTVIQAYCRYSVVQCLTCEYGSSFYYSVAWITISMSTNLWEIATLLLKKMTYPAVYYQLYFYSNWFISLVWYSLT